MRRQTVRHTIKIKDKKPIFLKPSLLQSEKYEATKKVFDKIKKMGIVQESYSEWPSPLIMVTKVVDHVAIIVCYITANRNENTILMYLYQPGTFTQEMIPSGA